MVDFAKQQIKKDELNEFVLRAIEWVKSNQTLFLSVAGTILGVCILAGFFFVRFHTINASALDRLSIAQGQLFQGQVDKGIGMLNEVIERYGSSSIAHKARLLKADYLFNQQKYSEAEEILKPVANGGKPEELVPIALLDLGTAQENLQKFDDAITSYNKFLEKYPSHFFASKTYESLARVYEIKRSVPDAVSTYERIVSLYPGSGWATKAQERLQMLSQMSQPQPPAAQPQQK